jgi:hypothetical protein
MRIARRVVGVALVALTYGWPAGAQAQAAAPPETAAPAPASLTPAAMEKFLLEGKVVKSRAAGSGTTGTLRITLSDGVVTHDAQAQFIEAEAAIYRVQGYTEFNFRDCFCFNIAAYKVAVLLGIDNVPMSVDRRVNGKPAAVTWWIDDVAMTEEVRRKKSAVDPNPQRFAHYQYRQRVFDELIQNRDRNLGNTLYTTDWMEWMIDHTRAFRLNKDLGRPDELIRVERTLYDNLKKLTAASLTEAVGKHLRKAEIEALIVRRDAIVKVFDARIAKAGEGAVLYTYPSPQP